MTDVKNIFKPRNNVTVYQHDYHQYMAENALNETTDLSYEQEGSDNSEILSFDLSPIPTDVETENNIHNSESSEKRGYGLRSIYEIRILHTNNTFIYVAYQQYLNCYFCN